ncbi:MAG: UMP kinase [Gammaproteobacteria bacterium]|jgi:uridylate kinase|nr:UMP kinase [Gammaproteobacteria bacterium]MBT5644346.1 UMP kinase [Gammaproteobacteria bacterium]MBT5862897.1 UMP kinase [Gammaproteobacteria bacterium]MBT6734358.1 UMP kinase [Gammaproteobacteria bacterium]MBT7236130.1 UMP kinase [Gammaproteobacteria bacterium]|tara:strand:+ start:1794 stop:2507 length:714 start_codon:yes stop_codon:yes gene_type:complete
MTNPKYKRVLLKLSGEALIGTKQYGIDDIIIKEFASQISQIQKEKIELIIVIGGGNFFRGSDLEKLGIQRVTADHMGMLATVTNSLALQSSVEQLGIDCRVMSSITIDAVCEKYIKRKAERHLEKGRVIILAAGTGNPYFTTDSAASLRAIELNAEIMLKGTKVDGIYDKDPVTNSDAILYNTISYSDILKNNLEVMDATAVIMCKENNMPLKVFNILEKGNLKKAILSDKIGTIID